MNTIRRVAISRIKYNKGRSFLSFVAIALLSALLMVIGTSATALLHYQKAEAHENSGNYHAILRGVSAEQLFMLENHTDIEALTTKESVAAVIKDKLNATLYYESVLKEGIKESALADGFFPNKADEIAGPPSFFERLGVQAEIGEAVDISFRIQGRGAIKTKEFTIVGLLEQKDISKLDINEARLAYGAFISEEFIDEMLDASDREYNAAIRVNNEESYSKDSMEQAISRIADGIGMKQSGILYNEGYLTAMLSPGIETQLAATGFSLLVVLLGGMVIYSIYYVSVVSNIQELGKLKAMGATQKQLRKLLLTEGMAVSAVGIPVGIALGLALTKALFVFAFFGENAPGESMLYWQIITGVIFIVLFTVTVSLQKPMRMAAGTSPVEAMRYQETQGAKGRKRTFKTITVPQLSFANLQRNKRRTVVTMLALGFTGVFFMMTASVVQNITAENYARVMMPQGDFKLSLKYVLDDDTYPENSLINLQEENHFDAKLLDNISRMDGITSVKEHHMVMGSVEHTGYSSDEAIEVGGFTRDDMDWLQSDLKKGSLQYDEILKRSGVIFTWDSFFEERGFNIGDTLRFTLYDGENQIPFEGVLMASTTSSTDTFLIPDELLMQLITRSGPTTSLTIEVEPEDYDAVKTQMMEIEDSNLHFNLVSIDEETKMAEHLIRSIRYVLYGLLAIIGIISYMSLINTMITSILVRRRELGTLQAVGLTDRQLRQMLYSEGMFFSLSTLALALVIGNGLGYLLVRFIISTSILAIRQYQYPSVQTLMLAGAVFTGQLATTFFISRYIHRDSLIERMRE